MTSFDRDVLRTDLPWADVIIDITVDLKVALPTALPTTLRALRRTDNDSVTPLDGTLFGILDGAGPMGSSRVVLRWAYQVTGETIAVVYPQNVARIVSEATLSLFLGIGEDRNFARRNQVEGQTFKVLKRLGPVGRLLRSQTWMEGARTWAPSEAGVWLLFLLAGITEPRHRALLEASGCRVRGGRMEVRNNVAMLREAVGGGMSVEDCAEWWPLARRLGLDVARTGIRVGLRCVDVVPWQKTTVGIGNEIRGQAYLDERFAMLRAAKDQQWTPAAFNAVEVATPEGCTPVVWMQTWTRFMPAALAGAYAAAGYELDEAVRLHLAGDDPPMETLATLAALRGSAA